MDFEILLRTVPTVLRGKGAHEAQRSGGPPQLITRFCYVDNLHRADCRSHQLDNLRRSAPVSGALGNSRIGIASRLGGERQRRVPDRSQSLFLRNVTYLPSFLAIMVSGRLSFGRDN